MKLICHLINILISIIFYFSSKQIKNSSNSKLSTYQNYIYSKWIGCKFRNQSLSFKRPVNLILGSKYFDIGNKTSFGKFAVLTAWDSYEGNTFKPKVKIGNDCCFGDFLHLTCINMIEIGHNVLTGRWVTITDNSHGMTAYNNLTIAPLKRNLYSKGHVIIEDRVWIGDKVTILPGITIGEGSVIAANSVVTKNIPAYSVVAGNPARVIKQLKNG